MPVSDRKFSQELETSKRTRLTELRASVDAMGGWNPDATDASRPIRDFAEVRNMRKMRPNELETRSGYKQWRFPIATPANILSRCEFRIDEVFVDVTIYSTGSQLYALIVHPDYEQVDGSEMSSDLDTMDEFNPHHSKIDHFRQVVPICICGSDVVASCHPFQTYIMVSQISRTPTTLADTNDDTGTYALAPTDKTLSSWTVVKLGKEVTPAPTGFTFLPKTTGDLLCFIPNETILGAYNRVVSYQKDPVTGENVITRIAIKAPYSLANTGAFSIMSEPKYKYAVGDPVAANPGAPHLKSRGWWYRAVLKRKYFDVRGQEHIVTEAPSADWYVEDVTYCPPTLWQPTYNGFPFQINQDASIPPSGPSSYPPVVALPDVPTFTLLKQKFISGVGNGHSIEDPHAAMFFVAAALCAAGSHADIPIVFGNQFPPGDAPYKLAPTSFEISGSPNVVFTWANFKDAAGNPLVPITGDASLYMIDFYRTAYSYPDEKDNPTRSPNWGSPYNYGYVGTLHATDASFTDSVPDTGLLTEMTPTQTEGYLAGDFAGEVMWPYQDQLVLGNTRTKYRVRAPWGGMQEIGFADSSGSFTGAEFVNGGTDGYPLAYWLYRYVDSDGHLSDTTMIGPTEFTSDAGPYSIGFMFPRGYSPLVVSAQLIRGIWSDWDSNGKPYRKFFIESTVSLATGTFIATLGNTAFLATNPVETNIGATNAVFADDPGAVIWSDPMDAWSWPQSHFENEHDQDPITAMNDEFGRLYVFSDRGLMMTALNGERESVHTSGTGAGCISRYGCVKVDAELFSIAAGGMTRVEGSGSYAFPGNIQTEIAKRLRERIPGKPSLSGVRNRVSVSFMAGRGELFVTFPSTIEMGGKFPATTFVLKTLVDTLPDNPYRDEIVRRSAHQFDVAVPDPAHMAKTNPPMPPIPPGDSPLPTGIVIHHPHADNSMWSAWYDAGDSYTDGPSRAPALVIQDNDREDIAWPGQWSLQWQNPMGSPGVQKQIFGIRFRAEAQCDLYLVRGMLRTDGNIDPVKNTLRDECQVRQLAIQGEGQRSEYQPPVSGNLVETAGTPPAIRLVGRQPITEGAPFFGQNMFRIESMEVWYGPMHEHK